MWENDCSVRGSMMGVTLPVCFKVSTRLMPLSTPCAKKLRILMATKPPTSTTPILSPARAKSIGLTAVARMVTGVRTFRVRCAHPTAFSCGPVPAKVTVVRGSVALTVLSYRSSSPMESPALAAIAPNLDVVEDTECTCSKVIAPRSMAVDSMALRPAATPENTVFIVAASYAVVTSMSGRVMSAISGTFLRC